MITSLDLFCVKDSLIIVIQNISQKTCEVGPCQHLITGHILVSSTYSSEVTAVTLCLWRTYYSTYCVKFARYKLLKVYIVAKFAVVAYRQYSSHSVKLYLELLSIPDFTCLTPYSFPPSKQNWNKFWMPIIFKKS